MPSAEAVSVRVCFCGIFVFLFVCLFCTPCTIFILLLLLMIIVRIPACASLGHLVVVANRRRFASLILRSFSISRTCDLKTFLYRRAFDWPLILRASELSYWQITARYKLIDWLIDWSKLKYLVVSIRGGIWHATVSLSQEVRHFWELTRTLWWRSSSFCRRVSLRGAR